MTTPNPGKPQSIRRKTKDNLRLQTLGDSIAEAMNADIATIPANFYAVREYQLPLTNAEVGQFGESIDFINDQNNPASSNTSSTFIGSNGVSTPFLLLGVAIVVVHEPFSFTESGASVAAPAASQATPRFDGVVPNTGLPNATGFDTSARPATLEHGGPTWRFAEAFLQAYRMQMILGGKFQLFDELLSNVGWIDGADGLLGASSSQVPIDEWVAYLNARMGHLTGSDPLAGTRFLRPNSQCPPTCSTNATIEPSSDGVPAPVVGVTYGGPRNCGVFNGIYPTPGILLMPGQPIQQSLVADRDSLFRARMLSELQNVNASQPDALFTEAVVGGTGFAGSKAYKSGLLRVGILFKGLDLTPKAALEWYVNYGGLYPELIQTNIGAYGVLEAMSRSNYMVDLGGLPEIAQVDPTSNLKVLPQPARSELADPGRPFTATERDTDQRRFSRSAAPSLPLSKGSAEP